MDVSLLVLVGHMNLHLVASEYLRKETRLHGVTRSHEAQSLEAGFTRSIRSSLHDANEGNRRDAFNIIEHDMCGVGCQQREVCSCGREPAQLLYEKLDQLRIALLLNQTARL